jgi:UDP-3-O-[3-hydroxymyristoyl] glucosamine N-acyltransferase
MRVRELAEFLDGTWEGDGERELRRAAPVESAGPDEIAFISGGRGAKPGGVSTAGCLLVSSNYAGTAARTLIRVKDPRDAMARAVSVLHPKKRPAPGIHPAAVIAPTAILGEGVAVGAHVVIGEDARIGEGARIDAGTVIGDGVILGRDSTLYPRVTIYAGVTVGARAVLHSGVVLGADGFGFIMRDGAWENFPQVGRVEIGDDVEIGANSCVDRAALGVTSIGDGTKLDNMVHIAHNCRIGRHVVIAAQTGLAGGVRIDDYAVIGGQVGMGDKAHIESKATVGSGAGILTSKIVRSGQVVWGTPARPLREYLEQLAVLSKLPEMRKEWLEMKRQLEEITSRP